MVAYVFPWYSCMVPWSSKLAFPISLAARLAVDIAPRGTNKLYVIVLLSLDDRNQGTPILRRSLPSLHSPHSDRRSDGRRAMPVENSRSHFLQYCWVHTHTYVDRSLADRIDVVSRRMFMFMFIFVPNRACSSPPHPTLD
jgi:hypothetical protein